MTPVGVPGWVSARNVGDRVAKTRRCTPGMSIHSRPRPRTMTLHSRRPPILILSTSVESMAVDFDDGIGESLRSFLRQIVTYTAHNGPVCASA